MSDSVSWLKFAQSALVLCALPSTVIGALAVWSLYWPVSMFWFLVFSALLYGTYQFINMFVVVVSASAARTAPSVHAAGIVMLIMAFTFFGAATVLVWSWQDWAGVEEGIKRVVLSATLVRGFQGVVYGAMFTARENN